MPRIPVKDLRPGQVTASPVTSAAGIVLVQAGTELSAALIARLLGHGIESVAVSAGAMSPEERAARLTAIDVRFAGHEGNGWMAGLKAIVIRQQAGEEPAEPHA